MYLQIPASASVLWPWQAYPELRRLRKLFDEAVERAGDVERSSNTKIGCVERGLQMSKDEVASVQQELVNRQDVEDALKARIKDLEGRLNESTFSRRTQAELIEVQQEELDRLRASTIPRADFFDMQNSLQEHLDAAT